MSECYHNKYILNGEIKDSSTFDIDLVFRGESIYEVVRIIEKIPLFWEDHVQRLYRTSEITGMSIWYDESFLHRMISELIRINAVEEGNIKLVFNFHRQENIMDRNFLAYFVEPVYPSKEQCEKGVRGILFQPCRNNRMAKLLNRIFRLGV